MVLAVLKAFFGSLMPAEEWHLEKPLVIPYWAHNANENVEGNEVCPA